MPNYQTVSDKAQKLPLNKQVSSNNQIARTNGAVIVGHPRHLDWEGTNQEPILRLWHLHLLGLGDKPRYLTLVCYKMILIEFRSESNWFGLHRHVQNRYPKLKLLPTPQHNWARKLLILILWRMTIMSNTFGD